MSNPGSQDTQKKPQSSQEKPQEKQQEKQQKTQTPFEQTKYRISGVKQRLEFLRQQNEKEKNKGFNEGGTSTKASDKGDENEIANLEAELKALESQSVEEAQKELKGIFDEAKEDGRFTPSQEDNNKGGGSIRCGSEKEAIGLANAIRDRYEALGFPCAISKSEDGKTIIVSVTMPKEFANRSPMDLSAAELEQAREAMKNEKAAGQGVAVKNNTGTDKEVPGTTPAAPGIIRPTTPTQDIGNGKPEGLQQG